MPENNPSQEMHGGTGGTASGVGSGPTKRVLTEWPEIHEYITLLEAVAGASYHRQEVWSHLSAYPPKQHQQAQKDLTAAFKALEAFG